MLALARLAALVAVAETGSITSAAARLGYSPPALSQQLTKLEREAGGALLVRHRRGVRLTAAGEVLVEHARRVLDEVERARHAVARVAGLAGGRVRIGSFASAGMHVVPPVLTAFRRAHPGTELRLLEFEPPAGLPALAAGELDLVLTHEYEYEHGPVAALPAGVTCEPLLTEERVLVTSPGHALTQAAEPLPVRELAERPLISGPLGMAHRQALEACFRRLELPPPAIAFETTSYAVACALAGAGMAMAVVPEMAVATAPAPVGTRRLGAPGLHRTISLAWRTDDPAPSVPVLRTLFRQALRQTPS